MLTRSRRSYWTQQKCWETNEQQFFPFRIRSGTYIITTTALRVKEFGNILCISSIFSPPTFLGIEPHVLCHSSPGGKAEGNSCTWPLQSQEPHYFLTASSDLPSLSNNKNGGRGWQGECPLPCSPLHLPRVSRHLCKVSPRNCYHKSLIAACKRASVKNIRVDLDLDKLLFCSFLTTNASVMQQLILK